MAVTGPDVSHYQGNPNWRAVRAAGHSFAFCKATEGVTTRDSTFASNWAGIGDAGLVRGCYHFAHPANNPISEAGFFVDAVREQGAIGASFLALDLEDAGGAGPAAMQAWIRRWVGEVKAATGVQPLLYTGLPFWRDQVGDPPGNDGAPLWFAHFASTPGSVPRAWRSWSFWQYTQSGACPGIGTCDLSRFYGTTGDLHDLVARLSGGSMTLTPQDINAINTTVVGSLRDPNRNDGLSQIARHLDQYYLQLRQDIAGVSTPTVDLGALASALAPLVAREISSDIAKSVADLLAARLQS